MNNSNVLYPKKKQKPGKATAFFICVLIASILWLLQALNTVYNHTITVPVKFKNLPQNKKPLIPIPQELSLDIKVSGLKLFLVLVNRPFKTIEIDFNLLKSTNNQQHFILTGSAINFKSSLKFETKIKSISPDTLYFSEKNGLQKNVPVKVPLFIKCSQGYGFNAPTVKPAYITIWGTADEINKIDTIYTSPLNLTNINESHHSKLVIIKPNSAISISEMEVEVFININKLIEYTITLPVNVIKAEKFKQVTIFPNKVKVKFTSLQTMFNLKDTSLFRAIIDPTKINSNNKCNIILTEIPVNVTVLSMQPKDTEILIVKN